nr:alpha/beta hydrolase domain-containing protein [Methylorubrum aminovorans]
MHLPSDRAEGARDRFRRHAGCGGLSPQRGEAASNPAGGAIRHTLALGISQSGRYLRDFIQQGFNRDEAGKRVFDGVLSHIAGVGGVFLNARFGQPSRTNTQHEDHLYPENTFPFSAARLHDPITGRTGSILRDDGFDPLLIEANTGTEYWQKGASS